MYKSSMFYSQMVLSFVDHAQFTSLLKIYEHLQLYSKVIITNNTDLSYIIYMIWRIRHDKFELFLKCFSTEWYLET